MNCQFHDFFKSNFWRVFDIWPKCDAEAKHEVGAQCCLMAHSSAFTSRPLVRENLGAPPDHYDRNPKFLSKNNEACLFNMTIKAFFVMNMVRYSICVKLLCI